MLSVLSGLIAALWPWLHLPMQGVCTYVNCLLHHNKVHRVAWFCVHQMSLVLDPLIDDY